MISVLNLFRIRYPANRNFGLDLLRALAILFVLYAHALSYIKVLVPLKYARHFMFDGVGVFFVLSGFLIGRIFIKHLQSGQRAVEMLRQFWLRRWIRTLPNYFLVLTVLVIFNLFFRDLSGVPVHKYFFFVQNLFADQPMFFAESWSLSVEEWFYISFPITAVLTVYFGRQKPLHALLFTAAAFIFFSIAMRYFAMQNAGVLNYETYGIFVRTHVETRLDGLMFGVLMAILYMYQRNFFTRQNKLLFLAGLAILTVHIFSRDYIHLPALFVFSNVLLSVGIALCIPFLMQLKSPKTRLLKIITFISLTSYSAYLINLSVIKDIVLYNAAKFLPSEINPQLSAVLHIILFLGLTFLASAFLYRNFEKPILNYRDRITENKRD